jgi:hypothetical protein
MNRSIENVNKTFEWLQHEEKAIREDRGRRYGDQEDTLANVSTFGIDGAIISYWETAMRMKNKYGKFNESFYKDSEETPEDYMRDMLNIVNDGRNYLGIVYRIALDEYNDRVDKENAMSHPELQE